MKKWKKIIIGIFFMAWNNWIYEELEDLCESTETPLDDAALEAVDAALEILENRFKD